MAKNKGHWDFECPQFVDFVSGLDSSCTEDVFFDADDHRSPGLANLKSLVSPGVSIKEKILAEHDENELMDKMEAALSIIECTPKLPVKKHFSEKVTSNHPNSQMIKTTCKRKTIQGPASGLHRSKSIAVLNKIIDKENKTKGLRKRSSSLNDLRTNKKQTYPRTPMCLKRTIFKAKAKIKTTEEMQLEEIAKLQKQLKDHLRYNEISLKKLRLKPKEHILTQKNTQGKTEKLKQSQVGEKGLSTFTEKQSISQKETRRNIQRLGVNAIRSEALKLNAIINCNLPSNKVVEKSVNLAVKSKNPSTASSYVSEISEKEKPVLKKANATKKYGFHSGILFHDNVKKNTVVKPFSFDIRNKEMKSQNPKSDLKTETSPSSAKLLFRMDGKENIPYNKMVSQADVEKLKGIKNAKCDIIKQIGSSKIIGKQTGNQIRGLALSENIPRKN